MPRLSLKLLQHAIEKERSLIYKYNKQMSQFIDTTLKKQKENDRKEPDEDGAFFTSLIPSVKLLTNDEKIQFRIEVLQILQRFKKNKTANTGTYSTIQYRNPQSLQYGHACSYPNYLSQFSPECDSAQY
jgi:hypothetical protein